MGQPSELVDVEVFIHAETDDAIKVSSLNTGEAQFWLPKSQVEINSRNGQEAEITLPRWLAENRGMA